MFQLTCSNCGRKIFRKRRQEYKNCFCSKQCESDFRKGKLTRPKKTNEIIIEGNNAIIKIQNNILGELDCLIDVEDVELVKNYFWNIRYDKRHPDCTVYVESRSKNNKRVHLHRLITNCPSGLVVDHINGDGLNNKKNNLRIVTQSANCKNRNTNKRDLPVGVYKDNRVKCERYYTKFNDKYLGKFKTPEEAQERYLQAKENYFTSHKIFEINQQLAS